MSAIVPVRFGSSARIGVHETEPIYILRFFSSSASERLAFYHPIALATVLIQESEGSISVKSVTSTTLRSPPNQVRGFFTSRLAGIGQVNLLLQGEHFMTLVSNPVSRAALSERRILIR